MSSPTQRSLKYLRALGYDAQVVEKWNSFAKVRIDLFGWIDIVAVNEGRILGVQTTSAANVSSRALKARGNRALKKWLAAGGQLVLHGWIKKKNRWVLHTEREMAQEDLE